MPAAGIAAMTGESFSFEVEAKDWWNDSRNCNQDETEVFEYDLEAKKAGDQWANCAVAASGHGTYSVMAMSTVALRSYFTFSLNCSVTTNEGCVHLLEVALNVVCAPACPASLGQPPPLCSRV